MRVETFFNPFVTKRRAYVTHKVLRIFDYTYQYFLFESVALFNQSISAIEDLIH